MYIVADVEWVENHLYKKSPTQLSAVRVDENWEIVDDFSSFIRPMNPSFYDWGHVAYAGGVPSDFTHAPHCFDVFKSFNEWVGDDTICWWYSPSADMHAFVNRVVLKGKTPKQPIILSEYIPGILNGEGVCRGGAYKIARARNISVPSTEHDSWNDVMAILYLFRGIEFPQAALSLPPVKPAPKISKPANVDLDYQYDVKAELLHKKGCPLIPEDAEVLGYGTLKTPMQKKFKACSCAREDLRQAKRARVIDEINRTHYTFMYAEKSKVFHRYDCGLLHNAEHVLGAVKYDTIAKKGLRPCRVCNPSPDDLYRPIVYEHKVKVMTTPKMAKHGLKRSELTAVARLEQAQKERGAKIKREDLTEQQRSDLFTLTQPRFAFFVGKGYQNFHTRACSRLEGLTEIRGFDTYTHAKNAGYTPCKHCRPTKKQDIVVSIPITNQVRADETITDLHKWCDRYGYEHRFHQDDFEVVTPVGKWKIHTDVRPVTVEHINLAQKPGCETYHKQHRIFLSMLDALKYIYRHDSTIMGTTDPMVEEETIILTEEAN